MAVSLNESKRRKPPAPAVKHSNLPPRELAMPWQGDPSLENINTSKSDPLPPAVPLPVDGINSQTNSRNDNETNGQTNSRTNQEDDSQTNSRTDSGLIDQVANTKNGQTNSRTNEEIKSQTNSRTNNKTSSQTIEEIKSQTNSRTNNKTSSQTNEEIKSQTNSRTDNKTSSQTKSQTKSNKHDLNKDVKESFDSVRYLRIWASSPKLKVLTLLSTCCSLTNNVYLTEELRLKPLAKRLKLTDSNFRKILGRLTADGALIFEKDLSKYGPNGWARYSIRKDLWLLLTNTTERSE